MNKCYILVENGVQDQEFWPQLYRFKEYGLDVKVVSGSTLNLLGKHGTKITADCTINDITDVPDILYIPGGWECPEKLRMNHSVINLVIKANAQKSIIAAICHGPEVLINANILRGKKCTAYKGIAVDIANAGGHYEEVFSVVVHDNLITSPHYNDTPEFMKAVLFAYEKRKERHILEECVIH